MRFRRDVSIDRFEIDQTRSESKPKYPAATAGQPHVVSASRCQLSLCILNISSASSSLLFGSAAGSSSIIQAGTVDEDKYGSLLNNLRDALAKAAQRRGYHRTAAGGKQGAF